LTSPGGTSMGQARITGTKHQLATRPYDRNRTIPVALPHNQDVTIVSGTWVTPSIGPSQ
jgi:hypothetical protein